jgi:flagellar transcriptional activator FlhD
LAKNHLERAVLKENSGMLRVISEFNRSYLRLAQRALRQGDIKGGQLLGVSDETAVLISQLTEAQIENLSNRSDLLCEIRLSDPAHLMARI